MKKESVLIAAKYLQKSHGGFFEDNQNKVRIKINSVVRYIKVVDLHTNEEVYCIDNNKFGIIVNRNKTMVLKLI